MSQLKQLFLAQVLTEEQFIRLKQAYQHYHHFLHQKIIQPEAVKSEEIQSDVWAICQAIYHEPGK